MKAAVQKTRNKKTGQSKPRVARTTELSGRSETVPVSRGEYDLTAQVGHLLRKAYQTHVAIFQSLNNHPSVTPTQFAVLCAVRDCGPCSLTVIGRHIVMDLATVRGIIERLSNRGFVSISRHATDRRQVIATLEPGGRRVLTEMIPVAQKISDATTQRLSVAEKVALLYLLERISTTGIEPKSDPDASATIND